MLTNNNKSILMDYLKTAGISGHENPIREVIKQKWAPWVDEFSITPLGSLHGKKKGLGSNPANKIMIAAHMDVIGFIVNRIENDFIYFSAVGGFDPRILPGQAVTISGSRDVPGIIAQPPDALLPPEYKSHPIPLEWLVIDTGLDGQELESLVKIGDPITFADPPIELGEELISGHGLDNRASVTALTICMEELTHKKHVWDVIAAATTSEELTLGGAYTSSFQEKPAMAIALDVTFAKNLGLDEYNTFPLGKGLPLGFGPNLHPYLYKKMKDLCMELDIPFHTEIMPGHSGTDAYAIQVSNDGIPAMMISIPLRYMHTPVETVHIKDITRAGHLLAEWVCRLDEGFIDQITWDD